MKGRYQVTSLFFLLLPSRVLNIKDITYISKHASNIQNWKNQVQKSRNLGYAWNTITHACRKWRGLGGSSLPHSNEAILFFSLSQTIPRTIIFCFNTG